MKRRRTNVKRACANIRLDLIEQFDINIPEEDITITWKGSDKRIIYVNALTGRVTGSFKEQFYRIGIV